MTDLKTREGWEKAGPELVLKKLAGSTAKSHSLGRRRRSLFCRARGASPSREVAPSNRRAERKLLLEFAVHLERRGKKKAGGVKQCLSAARAQHLAPGLPDLTEGAPRLWMAIDRLRRRHGAPEREKPVTPRMIKWIRRRLAPEKSREGAASWAAVATGVFFLPRASECAAGDRTATRATRA